MTETATIDSVTRSALIVSGIPALVLAAAAEMNGLEVRDLMFQETQKRVNRVAFPRFGAAWVLRQMEPTHRKHRSGTVYSYPRIAKIMDWADHTSAIYAVQRAEAMRENDPRFREWTDKVLAYAETFRPFRSAEGRDEGAPEHGG